MESTPEYMFLDDQTLARPTAIHSLSNWRGAPPPSESRFLDLSGGRFFSAFQRQKPLFDRRRGGYKPSGRKRMQSTLRPPNTLAEPHSPPYAPNPSPIHEANEFHPIEYQPQTPPYGPSPIQDISGATIG